MPCVLGLVHVMDYFSGVQGSVVYLGVGIISSHTYLQVYRGWMCSCMWLAYVVYWKEYSPGSRASEFSVLSAVTSGKWCLVTIRQILTESQRCAGPRPGAEDTGQATQTWAGPPTPRWRSTAVWKWLSDVTATSRPKVLNKFSVQHIHVSVILWIYLEGKLSGNTWVQIAHPLNSPMLGREYSLRVNKQEFFIFSFARLLGESTHGVIC